VRNPFEAIGQIFKDLSYRWEELKRSSEHSLSKETWQEVLKVLPRLQKDPQDLDADPLPQDNLRDAFAILNDSVQDYVRSVRFSNPSMFITGVKPDLFLLEAPGECMIFVDSSEGLNNLLSANFRLHHVSDTKQIEFYLNTNLILIKEEGKEPVSIPAGIISKDLTPKVCGDAILNIEEYLLTLTQLTATMKHLSALLKKASGRDST